VAGSNWWDRLTVLLTGHPHVRTDSVRRIKPEPSDPDPTVRIRSGSLGNGEDGGATPRRVHDGDASVFSGDGEIVDEMR
jgi:hypothetical protein